MAFGLLSIPKKEFMSMTPREFDRAYKGYRKRRVEDWEMARVTSYYSLIGHLGKKSKSLKFKDINTPVDGEKDMLYSKEVIPRKNMKFVKIRKLNIG